MLCFQFVNLFLLLIRIYSINTPNCTQNRHICFSFSIFKTCVNPHNHPTPESTPPVVISTSSHLPVQLIRAFITPLCCFCLRGDRTRSRRPRRAAGGSAAAEQCPSIMQRPVGRIKHRQRIHQRLGWRRGRRSSFDRSCLGAVTAHRPGLNQTQPMIYLKRHLSDYSQRRLALWRVVG